MKFLILEGDEWLEFNICIEILSFNIEILSFNIEILRFNIEILRFIRNFTTKGYCGFSSWIKYKKIGTFSGSYFCLIKEFSNKIIVYQISQYNMD